MRLRSRTKNRLVLLGGTAMLLVLFGFALFQLWHAWRYGTIQSWVRNARYDRAWISYADWPWSFAIALAAWSLGAIALAAFMIVLLLSLRMESRGLRRWFTRPPLDDSIRTEPFEQHTAHPYAPTTIAQGAIRRSWIRGLQRRHPPAP